MAVLANLITAFGESRELYVRVNSLSTSNHGVSSNALFRGYISAEAFQAGGAFMWELELDFVVDVSGQIWEQAYDALKEQAEFAVCADC